MRTKEIIKSQYGASLEMLRQAIEGCPDALWQSPEYKNQTWHIAYHTIFYTHLYLHPSEETYIPWEKIRPQYRSLEAQREGAAEETPFSREELLAFLDFCLEQMPGHVDALDLTGESGFYWLPFDKLELQIYNIRHIQQHTGELSERLGGRGDVEVEWVGQTTPPSAPS